MFDSIITTSQAKNAVDENNGTFVLLRLKDGFENILNGSKTMEILKSSCWNLKAPFFVLCCNDEDDKIIGSFICNKIDDLYADAKVEIVWYEWQEAPDVTSYSEKFPMRNRWKRNVCTKS